MDEIKLTDEQQKFLEECEEEFKDRYTTKDEDFMKIKDAEPKDPPIIDPWHNKPRRNTYEWSRQNSDGDSSKRNDNWEHRRNNKSDREYDRRAHRRHPYQRNVKS